MNTAPMATAKLKTTKPRVDDSPEDNDIIIAT